MTETKEVKKTKKGKKLSAKAILKLEVIKAEKLSKRIRTKAQRNTKKSRVTTKSFNDRSNNFVPKTKEIRNPDAIMYLRLKNKGLLTLKKNKPISYKEWQKESLAA